METNPIHSEFYQLKKTVLQNLSDLLDNVPNNDDKHSVHSFINFLNSLLRVRQIVPPTTEIMSIIKHQKPVLYHATRLQLNQSHHLHILFQLDMDPHFATSRLEQFLATPIDMN